MFAFEEVRSCKSQANSSWEFISLILMIELSYCLEIILILQEIWGGNLVLITIGKGLNSSATKVILHRFQYWSDQLMTFHERCICWLWLTFDNRKHCCLTEWAYQLTVTCGHSTRWDNKQVPATCSWPSTLSTLLLQQVKRLAINTILTLKINLLFHSVVMVKLECYWTMQWDTWITFTRMFRNLILVTSMKVTLYTQSVPVLTISVMKISAR